MRSIGSIPLLESFHDVGHLMFLNSNINTPNTYFTNNITTSNLQALAALDHIIPSTLSTILHY